MSASEQDQVRRQAWSNVRMLIVLSFDAEDPAVAVEALTKIDPPSLRGFAGQVRVVVEPVSLEVEAWLDE